MNLKITQKETYTLVPYARNARIHTDKQINALAESIKTFGFNVPVLIDNVSGIISGHGRVLAAQKLGMEKIPTIELSHLTEEQKKAYILADNRLSEMSTWDFDILEGELKSLNFNDFSMADFGFNVAVLEKAFEPEVYKPYVEGYESVDTGRPEAFTPNVAPTASYSPVTDNDVRASAQELSGAMTSEQQMIEVCCPHCAKTFEIQA